MKAKTSVTLSFDVLARIDRVVGREGSRSAFIENVLREHFHHQARRRMQARDRERINAAADQLNREALDVLQYQVSD